MCVPFVSLLFCRSPVSFMYIEIERLVAGIDIVASVVLRYFSHIQPHPSGGVRESPRHHG
jgi:hypothetical protein